MSYKICGNFIMFSSEKGCVFVSHVPTTDKERRTFTLSGPSLQSPDWEKQHGRLRTDSVQPGLAASRAVRAVRSPRAGLQHAIVQWVQANIHHFTLLLVWHSKDTELDESCICVSTDQWWNFFSFFISLTLIAIVNLPTTDLNLAKRCTYLRFTYCVFSLC